MIYNFNDDDNNNILLTTSLYRTWTPLIMPTWDCIIDTDWEKCIPENKMIMLVMTVVKLLVFISCRIDTIKIIKSVITKIITSECLSTLKSIRIHYQPVCSGLRRRAKEKYRYKNHYFKREMSLFAFQLIKGNNFQLHNT